MSASRCLGSVGPVLGGLLVERDPQFAFFVFASFYIVGGIVAILFLPEDTLGLKIEDRVVAVAVAVAAGSSDGKND